MTDEEKKALELAQSAIEAKMNALIEPVLKQMETVKGSEAEVKAINEQIKGINDSFKALQKQYDELDVKLQKSNVPDSKAPIGEQIAHILKGADWMKSRETAKRGGIIDLKGVDIMQVKASDVARTTDAIPYQWTPFQYGPQRRHIRDFLPVGTTTAPAIWMPYESAVTDAVGRVAEAGAKLQSDWTTTVAKFPVEKLATFLVFSEELLDDMEGLVSYITTQWIEKLKRVEDTQLLYGTGSSQLYGLTTQATAYSDVLASAAIDRWMVLDAAVTQVKAADYQPNAIFLHPTTAMQTRQTRESTYGFVMQPNMPMTINGVPVIEHAAMVAGDFLVGDLTMGCQLFDRMAANIRFYDQDSTNARYNKITAVIEERLALVTYHSAAFCFGNFGVALAQGSA